MDKIRLLRASWLACQLVCASLHLCIFASSSSLLTTLYFHPLATHATDLDKVSRIYFAALVYGRKSRICSRSRATTELPGTAVPPKPVRRICEFASTAMATSPYRRLRPLTPPALQAVRPPVRSSPSLPFRAKCCSHLEKSLPAHFPFATSLCPSTATVYLLMSITLPTPQQRFPHSLAGFCSMICLSVSASFGSWMNLMNKCNESHKTRSLSLRLLYSFVKKAGVCKV